MNDGSECSGREGHSRGPRALTATRLSWLVFRCAVQPAETAGFHLKMCESAWFCHFDRRTQRKRVVNRLLNVRTHVLGVVAGYDFDLHFELVHLVHGCHRHLKLIHASELADYIFDRGGIDVHTPDGHHIVAPAQQSAVEACECASAATGS